MLVKVLFLLCLLQAVESGSWKYLGYGCVGARNNQYLQLAYSGRSHFIQAIKLVHTSGYIGNNPAYYSYWGGPFASKPIAMIVTDLQNRIIYPSVRRVRIVNGWYSLPGYTTITPQLVLSDFSHPKYLRNGEYIRIWYGEDLYGHTEHNNHGRTCMNVYVYSM